MILHGTDTMAYTASALSFMIENLGKPVILTGSQVFSFCTVTFWYLSLILIEKIYMGLFSKVNEMVFLQIPIFETRSDGRDNFLGALIMAGHYCIPEV